jgi:hypothetical protein
MLPLVTPSSASPAATSSYTCRARSPTSGIMRRA